MASRLSLHEELCKVLGTRYVYFQPPESLKLDYPCVIYSRSSPRKHNANDKLYMSTNRYEGTVIDYDPDSKIPDKIVNHFPMCTLDRSYISDKLNHFTFTLYY